jgi:hypothetical protein
MEIALCLETQAIDDMKIALCLETQAIGIMEITPA